MEIFMNEKIFEKILSKFRDVPSKNEKVNFKLIFMRRDSYPLIEIFIVQDHVLGLNFTKDPIPIEFFEESEFPRKEGEEILLQFAPLHSWTEWE